VSVPKTHARQPEGCPQLAEVAESVWRHKENC
jgi:hypothetical protein